MSISTAIFSFVDAVVLPWIMLVVLPFVLFVFEAMYVHSISEWEWWMLMWMITVTPLPYVLSFAHRRFLSPELLRFNDVMSPIAKICKTFDVPVFDSRILHRPTSMIVKSAMLLLCSKMCLTHMQGKPWQSSFQHLFGCIKAFSEVQYPITDTVGKCDANMIKLTKVFAAYPSAAITPQMYSVISSAILYPFYVADTILQTPGALIPFVICAVLTGYVLHMMLVELWVPRPIVKIFGFFQFSSVRKVLSFCTHRLKSLMYSVIAVALLLGQVPLIGAWLFEREVNQVAFVWHNVYIGGILGMLSVKMALKATYTLLDAYFIELNEFYVRQVKKV